MGFTCGIVGLPNVGKSTLFNALTQAGIAAANFPFCTIEPNSGIVPVPDLRLEQLSQIVKPQKVVSTSMSFVDIAGLVRGASKGEGLGNQFLAHIRETDAIAHVVRCFEDDNIVHVCGKVDPKNDIDTIQIELILSDLEITTKAIQRLKKKNNSGDQSSLVTLHLLENIQHHLNEGKILRSLPWSKEEILLMQPFNLLTIKPTLYIANVKESQDPKQYLTQIKLIASQENACIIPICAALEADIALLDLEEKIEFLHELSMEEPGLNRLIRAGYQLLGLQTYFTAGIKEVRAWTIPVDATAAQAAGKIHSDFEKGFIRAEVISYQDYINYKGELGAKEAGKWRLEGKEYVVHDGDIIHFRFHV